MKKTFILMGLLVLSVFVLGSCATTSPVTASYADSGKKEKVIFSNPPAVSLLGAPKISNLEMPREVKPQRFFPYSFNYEAVNGVSSVFFQIEWSNGPETIRLERMKIEEGKIFGNFRLAPTRARSVVLNVYIEDKKGQRSNILTKELTLLWN